MSNLFSRGGYIIGGFKEELIKGLPIDITVSIVSQRLFMKESNYGVFIGDSKEYGYVSIQAIHEGGLVVGQTYQVIGKVVEYKGEKQIKAKDIIRCKPITKRGIIGYLQTLDGLGVRANTIYQEFKEDSIETIIKNPKLVSDRIRGISEKSVLRWQKDLIKLEKEQNVYTALLDYGLKKNHIKTLIDKYKEKTLSKIQDNPYILCSEISSFGFNKADKIALEMGIKPNNKNRVGEALKYVLEVSKMRGHCYLPMIFLYPLVSQIIDFKLDINEMEELYLNNKSKKECDLVKCGNHYRVNITDLKECIERYNISKTLEEKECNKYYLYSLKDEELMDAINLFVSKDEIVFEDDNVYLKYIYINEIEFAGRIKDLTKYKQVYRREIVEDIVDEICLEKGYELEYYQREACIEFNLCKNGVYILNGSAGTGKTFTLNLILEVSKRLNSNNKDSFLALAPTGRASKVVAESINRKCSTIHKALGLTPDNNKFGTLDIKENKIMCDETGMLDIEVGTALLKAIKNQSKLILLGDTNQLLSVGAGNILKDLIDSGKVKVITLNVPKRQGKYSNINYNANKVLEGKMIDLTNKTKDFFFLERKNNISIKQAIIDSYKKLLSYKEYSLEDIQVLIPQKKGDLGIFMINYLMQKELNGSDKKSVLKRTFEVLGKKYNLYIKEGDKVMHIKNNYNIKIHEKTSSGDYKEISEGLTNGDCGIVEEIFFKDGNNNIVVKYDSGYAIYDSVEELEVNYATTFHKSQGSAWKVVIMPITMLHKSMLSRNLFYTGITRATEKSVTIGTKEAVIYSVNCIKPSQRYTTLQKRLA